jgi:hypothetical protein
MKRYVISLLWVVLNTIGFFAVLLFPAAGSASISVLGIFALLANGFAAIINFLNFLELKRRNL